MRSRGRLVLFEFAGSADTSVIRSQIHGFRSLDRSKAHVSSLMVMNEVWKAWRRKMRIINVFQSETLVLIGKCWPKLRTARCALTSRFGLSNVSKISDVNDTGRSVVEYKDRSVALQWGRKFSLTSRRDET